MKHCGDSPECVPTTFDFLLFTITIRTQFCQANWFHRSGKYLIFERAATFAKFHLTFSNIKHCVVLFGKPAIMTNKHLLGFADFPKMLQDVCYGLGIKSM